MQSYVDELRRPLPDPHGPRRRRSRTTWHIGGPNNGVPATYFIDRQGVVRLVVFGSLDAGEELAEGLALILPEAT